MMNVKYLAISGKLKHGKDTLAEFVLNHIRELDPEICITKVAFADPIKEMAKLMCPSLSKEDLWGPSQNRQKIISGYKNPTTNNPLIVRDILTHIGKWGRETNEDCWVIATFNLVDDFVNKYAEKKHLIVISDCRFKNELEEIEKRGGFVVRVTRPAIGFTTNDPSEIDLDDVSLHRYFYHVKNEKGLDHMFKQAGVIAEKVIMQYI